MDLKDLNKPQLILLAILLAFVTAIATSITTVTLLQQAPISFTAPVNRVIQQTVEKIQQVEGKTTTVVVKEEDLVVDAIAKNKTALFTISEEVQGSDFKPTEVSAGRGFAVSTQGIIVADATLVPDKETYYVKNDSGKFKAEFVSTDKAGFSFLKIGAAVNGTDKLVFTVPAFGDLSTMKIGQQVLVLGNTVNSFIFEGLNANKGIDISVSKSNIGSLVVNLDGEAIGIALSPDNTQSFASIKTITDTLTPPATSTKIEGASAASPANAASAVTQ